MSSSTPADASGGAIAPDLLAEYDSLPNVLSFNAGDPTGAGGSGSDATVIAAIGAHALPVVTGVYVRDTRETMSHCAIDEAAVAEQAAAVAEDVPLHVIKVGFVGSAEAVSAIAAFTSDYASVPVVAYMPDLSWWSEAEIDHYLDACRELLLPQTTLLTPNSLEAGNVLASPEAELFSQSFERIDADFLGAGDILSAALAALIATGSELTEATSEALQYLDQALDHGFRPGMGRALADRLFWAASDADDQADTADDGPALPPFPEPFNETKH